MHLKDALSQIYANDHILHRPSSSECDSGQAWHRCSLRTYDPPHQIDKINPLIDTFARRYNTFRPHDALGQRPGQSRFTYAPPN